jgi:DNA-directed RNA polymerase subunit L
MEAHGNVIYSHSIGGDMKTYLIEDNGDSATIGFKDANITLITPIMKALYDDSDVEMVRYVDKHPELSDRTLYIKVKKGNALDALKKASKAVAEYYGL